jgi:hypothetical protein
MPCALFCVEPVWMSVNIGCFICLECSGAHRRLGTHISQVRSVTLDILKAEQLQVHSLLSALCAWSSCNFPCRKSSRLGA